MRVASPPSSFAASCLFPHGGVPVERIASPKKAKEIIRKLPSIEVRDQLAREIVNIAYGFFLLWTVSSVVRMWIR